MARPMEQLTVSELTETWTLADIVLYGSLSVVGFFIGFWVAIRVIQKVYDRRHYGHSTKKRTGRLGSDRPF